MRLRQQKRLAGDNDDPFVRAATRARWQLARRFRRYVFSNYREVARLKLKQVGTTLERWRLGASGVRVRTKSAQDHAGLSCRGRSLSNHLCGSSLWACSRNLAVVGKFALLGDTSCQTQNEGVVHQTPLFMPCQKLPNYLRTYRKRTGLSPVEVAFLMGRQNASCVSRYEHFRRTPGLRKSLAYQVIFQTSVRELFSGEYQKVESAIRRQAQRLAAKLTSRHADRLTARKLALLKTIISAATGEQP